MLCSKYPLALTIQINKISTKKAITKIGKIFNKIRLRITFITTNITQ